MKSGFINWIILTVGVICLVTNTRNITPVAHLVVIITDAGDMNVNIEVYNIDKDIKLLMTISDGKTAKTFYLIPENTKTSAELRQSLKSIKGVQQLSLVTLSNPVTSSELAEVRKLLLQNKMDANGVNDDELLMYLHSQLKGDDIYILHNERHNHLSGVSYLKLKPVSELLEHYKDDSNNVKIEKTWYEGDMAISEITISTTVSEEQPEPPPPPPSNFSKMTDAQIKKWYLKYDPTLKEEDIELKRTPKEIIITEKRNGSTGTTRYRINNNNK